MENEKRAEGKCRVFSLSSFKLSFLIFISFPFCFLTELEKRMAEATSTADALQRSLDAEVADRLALEAVVTSACEGLGVSASGSSLRSRVEALYSRAGEG